MAARSYRASSRSPVCVRDAIERLHDAVSLDAFSPLSGAAALVVDLDDTAGLEAVASSTVASAAARLGELPCVTVGLRSEASDVSAESTSTQSAASFAKTIEQRLDVIVTAAAQRDRLLDAVAAHPIAATALVQLLRHGERLDLHEALIAESLAYSTLQSGPEFAAWLGDQPRASDKRDGSSEPAVLVSRNGSRLDLVLNRPQRHNAYSAAMRDALVAGLEIAAADASISEVVLGGNGPSFSAGGDLAEFGTLPDPATAHVVRSTRNAARLLARLAGRVRAEVHGACIGAGVELAAFAKRVVARPDAFFELPEVAMGLVPGAGGTASIPRRIGRQRTAYLALTGERIDARTAHEWGLVDEIVA